MKKGLIYMLAALLLLAAFSAPALAADTGTAAEPLVTAKETELRILAGQTFTLAVEAVSPDGGTLEYQWFRLDADSLESAVLLKLEGATQAYYSDTLGAYETQPRYYICHVTNTAPDSVACGRFGAIITVTPLDRLPFTDVPADAWYRPALRAAYGQGLVDGVEETLFKPEGSLTVIEAVKLAACIHQRRAEGAVTLENGSPWYENYLLYALGHGLGPLDYEDLNAPISRRDFAALLYRALPETDYAAKNEIADGAIPDLPMTDVAATEVYAFYRAGILTGFDDTGAFFPDAEIRRSAVCAIIARMLDPALRESLRLG